MKILNKDRISVPCQAILEPVAEGKIYACMYVCMYLKWLISLRTLK